MSQAKTTPARTATFLSIFGARMEEMQEREQEKLPAQLMRNAG